MVIISVPSPLASLNTGKQQDFIFFPNQVVEWGTSSNQGDSCV